MASELEAPIFRQISAYPLVLIIKTCTTVNFMAYNCTTCSSNNWSSCIGHIIVSTFSCRVCEGHIYQNVLPLSGKLAQNISESHDSPKPILLHLKRKPQRSFNQKFSQIKTFSFERTKVKLHNWWLLTQTLWDILDTYTKWKSDSWATSGGNCRSWGWSCSKLWLIKYQGISRNLAGSNSEVIQCIMLKLIMSQETLCKNELRPNRWRSGIFMFIWHGMTQ